MKKILPLLILSALALNSCEGDAFEKKTRTEYDEKGSIISQKEQSDAEIVGEVIMQDKFQEQRIYAGTATREQHFCLSDCPACPATGPIVIKLLPDKTAVIEHTANCMKYGQKGCFTDGDQCLYTINGGYSASGGKINLVGCNNGTFDADGSASFDDESSSGNATCSDKGEIDMTIDWANVKRTQ